MKKTLVILAVGLITAVVLTACATNSKNDQLQNNTTVAAETATKEIITVVTEPATQEEITKAATEIAVEPTVTEAPTEKPVITTPEPVPPQNKPDNKTTVAHSKPDVKISREDAKAIVLKHAETPENDIRFYEVELDRERNNLVYEIEFEAGKYEYDYEVDANNGKILKAEKEYRD